MKALRKKTALGLVFVVLFLLVAGFTIMKPAQVEARKCCWVMVCTVEPPIICWEKCLTCPTFP